MTANETAKLKQKLADHADVAIGDAVAFINSDDHRDHLDTITSTCELVIDGKLSSFTIGSIDMPVLYAALIIAGAVAGQKYVEQLEV